MSEEITELEDTGGVGLSKADVFREAGFESVDDVQAASQSELIEANGIENAFATRIKADVGGLEVSDEAETEVEGEFKTGPEEEEAEAAETEFQPRGHVDKESQLDGEAVGILAQKRREDKPQFNRQDRYEKKHTPTLWRRPRGDLSKQRIGIKGKGAEIETGRRTPKAVHGLHLSGFEEVHVFNTDDLEGADGDIQAVHVVSSIGTHKCERTEETCEDREIRVLNPIYVKAEVNN